MSDDGARRDGAPGLDGRGRPTDADKCATHGCVNRYPGKAVEIFTLLTTEAHDNIIEKPPRIRKQAI